MVLVDLRTGARTDLGPGRIGLGFAFDPSSTWFTWLAGTVRPGAPVTPASVKVLNLKTRARRAYGEASSAVLTTPGQLIVTRGSTPSDRSFEVVDLATGRERPLTLTSPALFTTTYARAGVTVQRQLRPVDVNAVKAGTRRFIVVPHDGNPALVFRAASVIADAHRPGTVLALVPGSGAENLFRIDADTARATFIATARFSRGSLPSVVASDHGRAYLVLSDALCSARPRLLVYDIGAERLTAINTPLAPEQAPGPGLALGGTAQRARLKVDLSTLTYSDVLPGPGAWSPDGRWAAIGALPPPQPACAGATAP